jgi:hypothetical protein
MSNLKLRKIIFLQVIQPVNRSAWQKQMYMEDNIVGLNYFYNQFSKVNVIEQYIVWRKNTDSFKVPRTLAKSTKKGIILFSYHSAIKPGVSFKDVTSTSPGWCR